jgi:Transposase DDE domain group 1
LPIIDKIVELLADLCGRWIDCIHARRPPRGVGLDMDSSVSPSYDEQEMSAWNGHFACTCYHPLFVFNQFGDLERCMLRPGNVHSADGWESVLRPVIERYKGKVSRIYFRADAPSPIQTFTSFSLRAFGWQPRGPHQAARALPGARREVRRTLPTQLKANSPERRGRSMPCIHRWLALPFNAAASARLACL